jgi:DNA-binding response OmpR family regulator
MSKLIYVVDDESNIRTMMQLFLENEGFTVETFKDGQEACQAFSAKEPDMLILDIMMPGIDGLSLCTVVKAMFPLFLYLPKIRRSTVLWESLSEAMIILQSPSFH